MKKFLAKITCKLFGHSWWPCSGIEVTELEVSSYIYCLTCKKREKVVSVRAKP